MAGIYDFTAKSLAGEDVTLKRFEGQVLLIVNTASACGFTPQYRGLEALQKEFGPRGFSVLGFPCNQFGMQERGDALQIQQFCATNYQITFPMFAKIEVNGGNAHPLYDYLKSAKSGLLGSSIKWNFTKFLVDRSGKVVARHPPTVTPERLKREIEAMLRTRKVPRPNNCRIVCPPIRKAPTTMNRCWRAMSAFASRASRKPMSRSIASARGGCA